MNLVRTILWTISVELGWVIVVGGRGTWVEETC